MGRLTLHVFDNSRCAAKTQALGFAVLFATLIGFGGCRSLQPDSGKPTVSRQKDSSANDDQPQGLFAKTAKLLQKEKDSPQPVASQADTVAQKSTRPSYHAHSGGSGVSRMFIPDGDAPLPAIAETEPATLSKFGPSVCQQPPSSAEYRSTRGPLEEKLPENALKPQDDDSPKLRTLLADIEATRPENLKMSLADAKKKIAKYREDRQSDQSVWLENPQLEAQYLATLRNMIVPDTPATKKSVVKSLDETTDQVASRKTVRRIPKPDDSEEEPAETAMAEKHVAAAESEFDEDDDEPAPLPVSKPKRSTKRSASATLASAQKTERKIEDDATLPETSTPPNPLRKPKEYPGLAQLNPGDAQPAPQVQQGGIIQASYVPETNGDWKAHARTAVDLLRAKIENTPDGRNFANEGNLRLLELVLGNRQEAAKPFTLAEKPLNEFWGNQVLGLSTLFDEVGNPDKKQRYATAAFRFDEGLLELHQLCPLKLKNVQFVKDWAAYGVFLPRKEDCQAGDTVGLYLELENPIVKKSSLGYTVKATITYEIRDSASKIALKSEPIPVEESTPSQKRDYCIHLNVRLPKSLSHGQYQLRVNVTDMNSDSMQYAEEQLSFRVIPSARTTPD